MKRILNISRESTLLFLLRNLFESMTEYCVYVPDNGSPVILSKGQLVSLVERGCADSLIKTLPEIISRNIIIPTDIEEFETPEDIQALFIETGGAFVAKLSRALNPDEPQFPEWWEAPVAFAMSARGKLILNPEAIKLFGNGPEKLNANELPERDEFIVRIETPEQSRFLSFKKLQDGIFSLDDCTDDLLEAQDITWWAAAGQAWIKKLESEGIKWQRLNSIPDDVRDEKNYYACEWQGQFRGYIYVDDANMNLNSESKITKPNKKRKRRKRKKNINLEQIPEQNKSSDVIDNIGPQAMGLLTAGQERDNNFNYTNGSDFSF